MIDARRLLRPPRPRDQLDVAAPGPLAAAARDWRARHLRGLRKLHGRLHVLAARRRLLAGLTTAERAALRAFRIGVAPMALRRQPFFETGAYKIQILAAMLGVKLEPWSVWGAYDAVINWQDLTRDALDVRAYVEASAAEHDRPAALPGLWLNAGPVDISKTAVEVAHVAAFGYGAAVDPTRHVGRMVEKLDSNGRHEARLILGPLRPEQVREGRVYRRYIDTQGGDLVTDLRTMVCGGVGPLVMAKHYRAAPRLEGRFDGGLVRRENFAPEEVFSAAEIAALNRFAALMGLDLGELDVLRDRADGRLHVVDCNRTPSSSASPHSMAEEAANYEAQARALLKVFVLPQLRRGR